MTWTLAAAALAGVAILAREAAPGAWVLPHAARAALVVLWVVLGVRWARGGGAIARLLVAAAAALALSTALPWWSPRPSPERWRAAEETRLRARFESARAAVAAREARAQALATQARALVAAADSAAGGTTEEARARLFAGLADLVAPAPSAGGSNGGRSGGANELEPGIQVFGRDGALLAWAGSPHPADPGRRLTRLGAGTQPIYFRRSGVHTLLSYELHEGGADTITAAASRAPRVLVDLPVETRYRISNRFLQSATLSAALSGDRVEVDLVYDATDLPPYLTRADLEVHGDESQGLQAQGVIRDASGAALLLCHLGGLPYADAIERGVARRDLAARLLLVLGCALAVFALARARARPSSAASARRRGLEATSIAVVAIVALRFLLAALELPRMQPSGTLLNPAVFAMVGFGGILRSPFDLVLSAVALAAVAGVVFVHRARALRRTGKDAASETAPASIARVGLGALGSAACIAAAVWSASRFVERVASDSNVHLVGAQMDLASLAPAALHAALWLGVGAWLALAVFAAEACRRGTRTRAADAAGVALTGALLWPAAGGIAAAAGVLLYIATTRARRLLADDRFTSFGLAAFALVALAATLTADAIQRRAVAAQRDNATQLVRSILEPGDDVLRFGVEELLRTAATDPALRRALRAERGRPSAVAFELWAQSLLSQGGWSCRVSVWDAAGGPVDDFVIGMSPDRAGPARDLVQRARAQGAPILEIERSGSATTGAHTYVGAAIVHASPVRAADSLAASADGELGAVVVEVPFAPATLDAAADPRSRTPELLRQRPESSPRVDASERVLLAWLDRGFVVEASTPDLEMSRALSAAPAAAGWQQLRLADGDYLVRREPAGGTRELLAGFRLASPLDRVLGWTQVASFGFAATALVLLLLLAIARVPALARHMPPLLVAKRFGFQQKLMAAFLVVSLLPSAVVSLATGDVVRDRSQARTRDAAVTKARAAQAALADLVYRDLDAVRESEFVQAMLQSADVPPARALPEHSQVRILHRDGRIVLDETLSNLSDAAARAFVEQAPRRMFAAADNDHLYLGAVMQLWYSPSSGIDPGAVDARPYVVYYRRRVTDDIVRNLAPILGADVGVFLGPQLVASSQPSLTTAGLLPRILPPQAFTHLLLRRNPSMVREERAGGQRHFAGYLPLEDETGRRIGALSASQLLQADEFAVEIERTRELVLGLSTLMFVLTLVLGVAFATRIFDPVRNLIEGTRRIAAGDLGFRLRARSSDEIGELERSFNEMSARMQDARRALDERRRYLEAVLGHIASGVVATDGDGRITAANPAAYRILRLPPGSLEGRTPADLARGGDSALADFWRRLGEAPGGEVIEVPLHATPAATPGGALDRLTLRVIVTDLVQPDGETAAQRGRVAIFEDVSDLIRSQKLSAWAEMARQVAHEIKNPLTPMKLSAQFMDQAFRDQSPQFPRIFEEGMATIVEQVESLRRIATEFSNFGRVQKLEPRPLELQPLLRGVTAAYAGIEGLALDQDLDGEGGGDRPALRVLGDDEGLRRVFRNVLENAREAMNGRGRIRVRVERPSPDRVRIRFADSGPGVSAEAAVRLFEPYFSTKNTGTGLGLAICKSIVEELGGSITIANRPEGGAEAIVTLVVV